MKISATINRMVDNPDSATKAFASVTLDGMFAVHGLRVMESEKGRFVNMPSTSYKDRDGNTQYNDTFHAITKTAREAINQAVLNAYDFKLQQTQASEVEVEPTEDDVSKDMDEESEPGNVYVECCNCGCVTQCKGRTFGKGWIFKTSCDMV